MFWRQSSDVIASPVPSCHHFHFRDTSIRQFINFLLAKADRGKAIINGWIIQSRYFWLRRIHIIINMGNQPSLQSLALFLSARNAVFAEMHSQDKKGIKGIENVGAREERRGLHAPVCLSGSGLFARRDVPQQHHLDILE